MTGAFAEEPTAEQQKDALAGYMANVIAPDLAFLTATGRLKEADAVLEALSIQDLYGLLVVQADRCVRMFEGDRSGSLPARLVRAVSRYDQAAVAELLTPLSSDNLRVAARAFAARYPFPQLRPEDGIVDEFAIRRAAAGEPVLLSRVERDLAIRLMHRRGVEVRAVREHLRVSGSTVAKVLATPPPVQTDLLSEGATA